VYNLEQQIIALEAENRRLTKIVSEIHKMYRQRLITEFPYGVYHKESVEKVIEGIENELKK
jgi:Trm5-related predicted tRNA methylase